MSTDKIKSQKRESWIQNAMKKLGYSREEAESAYARIFSFWIVKYHQSR